MTTREEFKTVQLIGANIRWIRGLKDLSQMDLAKRAKVSQATIAQIERGKKNPSIQTLLRIAKVLRVEPCSLLTKHIVTMKACK